MELEQLSHYLVPAPAGYAGGYPTTSGSGRTSKISIRYIPDHVDFCGSSQINEWVVHNAVSFWFLVSLQDINMRKPFKSSVIKEQQVITKSTRPQSVMLMYQHYCEPAPALQILNPYRFVKYMQDLLSGFFWNCYHCAEYFQFYY